MKNSTVSMYSKSFLEITETIIKTLKTPEVNSKPPVRLWEMILCNFSTNIFLCRKFTLSTPTNIYYFWMFKDNFNGKIVFIGKLQWPTVLDKLPMPPECIQFMQAWNVFEKVDKNIGLLRKVQNLLQRKKLIILYAAFVRPRLN